MCWVFCVYAFILMFPTSQEVDHTGFPGSSVVKNSPVNAGDVGSPPGSVRSHGEGNGNPLQYTCLGNLLDTGAWQAVVHRVTEESDTT